MQKIQTNSESWLIKLESKYNVGDIFYGIPRNFAPVSVSTTSGILVTTISFVKFLETSPKYFAPASVLKNWKAYGENDRALMAYMYPIETEIRSNVVQKNSDLNES